MSKLSEFKNLSLSSPCRFTLIFAIPFTIIIIILLISLILWEMKLHKEEQQRELLEAGRAFFSEILVARKWNSMHDGVYVKITGDTQPNPFLKIPERDITSTKGERYTMVNPAYMTRQMSELAEKWGQFRFHITSLKFINPINKPDQWETRTLTEFGKGSSENHTFVEYDNERVFRYMAPLYIGETCLKCHHEQGYAVGDIRGGISVSIPITYSDSIHAAKFKRTVISYCAFGLAALLFVIMITWVFSKTVVRSIGGEVEKNKLKASMVLAGAAAHELRQPLTILMGFSELVKDKEEALSEKELDIITEQCNRMDNIIGKMLNITRYKTMDYANGIEIFDLGSQEKKTEEKS